MDINTNIVYSHIITLSNRLFKYNRPTCVDLYCQTDLWYNRLLLWQGKGDMMTYWLVGEKSDDEIKLKLSQIEIDVRHEKKKRQLHHAALVSIWIHLILCCLHDIPQRRQLVVFFLTIFELHTSTGGQLRVFSQSRGAEG